MYRLALKLGYVNVDRMLMEISPRQLQEWIAFEELEPFDGEREDLRAGSIIQAIYNVNRRKGAPPFKLDACSPKFGDLVRGATVEQAATIVAAKQKALDAPKFDWRALKAYGKAMTEISLEQEEKRQKRTQRSVTVGG